MNLCACHVQLRANGRELNGQRHRCIRPEFGPAGQPLNAAAHEVLERRRRFPEGLPSNPAGGWVQLGFEALGRTDPSGLMAARMRLVADRLDDARLAERRQRRSA